ncbi:MAG: F0F1 ATP synthase subunit A [Bacillota bacterium]
MESGAANSETIELKHESPLYAEPIFEIGGFPITNSWINSFVVVLIVVTLCLSLRGRIKLIPKGLQNLMETAIESLMDLFDTVTHSREKTIKFAPLVLSLFFFILINNWLGLLPGVGTIGRVVSENGEAVFVPFLRGGTADLNTTLALAIIGVFMSHVLGVVATGWWHYFNKFINIKAFLQIPKKIMKEPTIVLVNPIKAFVGLIEIIGEAAKVASLSFRLFGNIFAGEVLLVSMSAIMAFVVPIPFMFLEIIVGLIQAFIFSILILTYLSINTTKEEH